MKHYFSAELQPIGIDEQAGVIFGAVACQAGLEARGHNLVTDRVLLSQLLMSAKAKGDKLPVHLDHKSGAAGCIGTAENFRLDGDKLRCDLHFFRTHDKFQQTMEMLSALHETAGLSASFVGDSQDGKARCREFMACDVVIFPAAVANGLFSALDENSDSEHYEDTIMDQPIDEESLAALLHELLDHIEQIEAENAALAEALGVHQDDDDESDDEDEPVIEERGARGGPNTQDYCADGRRLSPVGAAMQTTEFSEKVRALELTGLSKGVAYSRAAKDLAREAYRPLNL